MNPRLLVFDTHPVQYRVPIWRTMEKLRPGSVHVAYASDCSVKGHADSEFGQTITWDVPMLAGYPHSILHSEKGIPLSGWSSLTGRGVGELIRRLKPAAVLLTGMNYRYYIAAYIEARRNGIPVWLRCETQDYAYRRSKLKDFFRSAVYRTSYLPLDLIFFIGELNHEHYIRHKVNPAKLRPSRYGTVDGLSAMTEADKKEMRRKGRAEAGIASDAIVVGFSGKFITKKNPDILFHMLAHLPHALQSRMHLYFMGSGDLQHELEQLAGKALLQYGVKTYFAGFVNQSKIAFHYLAMDIMILPSRRMGETWGLVANEALHAGCCVIVSDAVGCSADFYSLERFMVFPEGSAEELAQRVVSLSKYERDFEWARFALESHSIEATAESLLAELEALTENKDQAETT